MQTVSKFHSVEDVLKNIITKFVPNLEEKEIETKIESNVKCPDCGQKENLGLIALYYRRIYEREWTRLEGNMKCSNCRDKEVLTSYLNESLIKQRQEIIERLVMDYYLIPEGLYSAEFKNYVETNKITSRARTEALQFTMDFLDKRGKTNNLLLMGNPGTGKTHLCAAIAKTIKNKGFSVGFLTTIQILSKIKSTFHNHSTITEEDIFKDIKKLDLLILDDVGAEVMSGSDDWRKGMIFNVVESRIGKPTIYTSNLTDIDLPAAVGDRLSSRLYNNTKFIDLFTDDYRKRLRIHK